MAEQLLTPEQAALRLQLKPATVRRQLQRGALRGVKRGRVWRVPESALAECSAQSQDTAAAVAADILARLDSRDQTIRNAAIRSILQADAKVRALVDRAAQDAVNCYDGSDDDFSDWHALDTEPFHALDQEEGIA